MNSVEKLKDWVVDGIPQFWLSLQYEQLTTNFDKKILEKANQIFFLFPQNRTEGIGPLHGLNSWKTEEIEVWRASKHQTFTVQIN